MDKKCIPHSHATLCVLLCLATLLCFTSCFNLNSNQRGNFSFTINEAVAQQLENALGPRSARSASGPVITATVTLTQTAGGQLAEPAIKNGTLTSLRNETFTFEGLPLSVPFTVSVSFTADEKELFSGTSEPITLTSEDTTQVAIALKHILDTDIVVPVWDDERDEMIGSFRFGQADNINAFNPRSEEASSQYCGSEETCFDAYGNIWSIASIYFDENSYLEGCLLYSGSNGLSDYDPADPFSIFTQGIVRALIPNACFIECDYSTNSLFVFYQDADTGDFGVLKLSVDELLSIDTEKEIIVLSGIESLDDYWESFSLTDLQNEFTLRSVEPFVRGDSGDNGLLSLLYEQPYEGIEPDNVAIEKFDFAVNNGTVYAVCEVWDNEEINGYFLVSIDPVTKTCQLKKLDFNSIFGADTNLRVIKITDLLCLDGKLYALVSYRNTTGALVRIDPATLTFSSSDVLGVSSDIKTVPGTQRTDGWWMYKSGSEVFDAHELYYEDSSTSPRCETGPTFNYLVSNDSNGFLGPVKFVAIKPKKLIVADYGIYYYDETRQDIKRRLLTINLTNFSIEASETKDLSFDIADPSDVDPVVSISYPFTEGQLLWYGGTDKQSIEFTESMVAEYSGDSDSIPVEKMYYYY